MMPGLDRTAYDELPDGAVVADRTGSVVLLNRAAERLLGTTAGAQLGRPLAEVLPLTDSRGRDWWTCTDPWGGLSSRTRQPEQALQLPDGTSLLVTASFVRNPARVLERVVVLLRDDRARERADRSNADLVSTVAHELRSPLVSVKGFTATLLRGWDRFDDAQKQLMLQAVHDDAERVTRLLGELLDVGRIEAGRVWVRRQVVDLPALVEQIVAGRVASGEPADRFVVERSPLPELWADPDKLRQVLANLIENAVLHGAGTVTVGLHPHEDGLALTVSDQGEGIVPEQAARVFGRFWQGGDRHDGSGLGLFIVKGLVEAHGGTVEVTRAPGGGAAFRLLLPAGAPDYLLQ